MSDGDRIDSAAADRSIYPPYIQTDEERRRWNLAEAIARELFGDLDAASVWMATRAIFRCEIPTDG
jgi:hypothetical protein